MTLTAVSDDWAQGGYLFLRWRQQAIAWRPILGRPSILMGGWWPFSSSLGNSLNSAGFKRMRRRCAAGTLVSILGVQQNKCAARFCLREAVVECDCRGCLVSMNEGITLPCSQSLQPVRLVQSSVEFEGIQQNIGSSYIVIALHSRSKLENPIATYQCLLKLALKAFAAGTPLFADTLCVYGLVAGRR